MQRLKQVSLLIYFSVCLSKICVGQHNIDFQIPAQVCIGEVVNLENASDVGTANWNFCNPIESPYVSSSNGIISTSLAGISLVNNDGVWVGFAITRANELLRIDFGDNPSNSNYTKTSLGNTAGLLNSPDGINILKSNDKWYGFITNQGNNEIVRLIWNDLSLPPIAQSLNLSVTGKLNSPAQIEVEQDGDDYVAVVANSGSNQLALINFGTSLENIPTDADIILSPIFNGSVNMYGVTVKQVCGEWIIYTTVTNKMFKVTMGSSLYNTITPSQMIEFSSDIPIQIGSYVRLKSIVVGGDTYVYFTSYTSQILAAFVWRNGAVNAEFIDLTSLSVPDQLYSLEAYSFNNSYGFYVGSFNSGLINHISINHTCAASQATSTEYSPQGISFNSAGNYTIILSMKFVDGVTCGIKKNIIVKPSLAPDITLTTQNICTNNNVNFMSQNNSGDIASYDWSFGDSNTSALANPNHQYTASGNYSIQLDVTSTNGCHNFAQGDIKIYDPPTSSFTLPSGLICTNNEFTFTNNTVDNFDGNLAYQWYVDNSPVSVGRDLKFSFLTVGSKAIKLTTSIPGCSNESEQTLNNIQDGPTVGFTATGQCQDETVIFTNSSSGNITGYQWEFGDGSTSTELNPVYTYLSKGNYPVSLIATSSNGCSSELINLVTIYSKPQTNFSIDLPPFSCAGSPSQFNDLTPTLTDSNIATWSWNFGDVANGSSSQKNPTYTYALAGDYQVSLSATTNFGCNAAIQKQVTISMAPSVNFSNGIACFNQGTQFTDASDPTAKAWLWSVQNSTYTTKNPTHVFTATGSLPVILTVTGNNNCISQISKQVNVPVPIIPDFTALNKCVGKPTVFQEINVNGNDPAVSWSWDFVGQGVSNGSPAEHVFPNTGSFAVKMNTTRQSGCVYSVTKSVTINQSPHAQFVPSTESGGSPLTVGFSNMSTQANSYLWKFKDANNTTSTDFSPSFIFNQIGEYPVELIASNSFGCEDSYERIIQVVVPSINATLSDFKLIPSGGSMKARVTITNLGNVSITNPDVFVDLSGNATIKEKVIATILPNQSVTQTLSVDILPKNLRYACAELNLVSDTYSFDNRQCINLETETIAVQPYPNPAQDELFIDWINQESESMQIIIYNASGQVVLDKKYEPTLSGLNQVKVNISDLKSGIYFVSYFDGNVTRNARFSIVR
jgi:PKD repeat protein